MRVVQASSPPALNFSILRSAIRTLRCAAIFNLSNRRLFVFIRNFYEVDRLNFLEGGYMTLENPSVS